MRTRAGCVLWFTGLSGSGKTTTARRVETLLRERGTRYELLDGDELRNTICKGLGFSREERIENIKRIAYITKLLSRNGVTVLVSAITPYRDMREYLRNEVPGYTEVYVKCSLAECERRDVKGLYVKARSGVLARFTGISDPYDEPTNPDLVIDSENGSLERNTAMIMQWIERQGRFEPMPVSGGDAD